MRSFTVTHSRRVVEATSIAALCLGLTTVPAHACDEHAGALARASALVSMSSMTGRGSQRIELSIVNGRITVKLNGADVPADRLRQEDGRVMILDEEGREMGRVMTAPGAGFLGDVVGDAGAWRDHIRHLVREHVAPAGPPPAVMLGLLMDAPGPALEKQLQLEPGSTTIVSGVHEGLPAHAAGLAEHDVIVELDGQTPADPKAIQQRCADAKPGDKVSLTVISSGQKRKVSLTLDTYDAAKMSAAKVIGSDPGHAGDSMEVWESIPEHFRQLWQRGGDRRNLLVAPNAEVFRVLPGGPDVAKRFEELNERMERLEKAIEDLAAAQKAR